MEYCDWVQLIGPHCGIFQIIHKTIHLSELSGTWYFSKKLLTHFMSILPLNFHFSLSNSDSFVSFWEQLSTIQVLTEMLPK